MFQVLILFSGVFAAALALSAQETIHHASIGGRVSDQSGGFVEGAKVTARQSDTNLAVTASTDSEGRFRFPYLKVGPYRVTVHQTGFAEATRSLTLSLGGAYDIAFTLVVGASETAVTILEDATVLEAARSQITGTVAQTEIRNMSLNGRRSPGTTGPLAIGPEGGFVHLMPLEDGSVLAAWESKGLIETKRLN